MLNDLMTALQSARQQMPDRFAEVLGMAPEQPSQGYVPGTVGAAARDPQQVKSGLDALGNALWQIARSALGVTPYEKFSKGWQQGNPEEMAVAGADLAMTGPSGGLDDLLKTILPGLLATTIKATKPAKLSESVPQKTVKAYKLFKVDPERPGVLFPLYIESNQELPIGKWLKGEIGDNQKSKLGPLAPRPGWHAGDTPSAQHIGASLGPKTSKPTHRRPDEVWAEVELPADKDWQPIVNEKADRYKSGPKKGQIIPKTAELRDQLPEGGHYRYKTNPNMAGEWLIGSDLKINRVLSDEEVDALNKRLGGLPDLPRQEPIDITKYGFGPTKVRRSAKKREID